MAVIVIIAIAFIYGAFHAGSGHTHYRYQRAGGLKPNLYWSLGRGPYASIRLPGGFRVGHRL
jgi:hypothetical protein